MYNFLIIRTFYDDSRHQSLQVLAWFALVGVHKMTFHHRNDITTLAITNIRNTSMYMAEPLLFLL